MQAGKISYPGVGVTAGGLVGFLGVLVGWFSYSYPLNGGTATVTLSGTADWTGSAALVASIGAFAFGGAYVLIQDSKLRRTIGVLMAIASAFLLVMSLVGFGRVAEAVGVPTSTFTTATHIGLVISFAGGVIAMVGSLLASREMLAEGSAVATEAPAASAEPVEA
jgi:hypothetical protein